MLPLELRLQPRSFGDALGRQRERAHRGGEARGRSVPISKLVGYILRNMRQQDFRYQLVFPDKTIPFNQGNGDLDEPSFARFIAAGYGDLRIFDDALKSFVDMGQRHGFRPIVSYVPSTHNTHSQKV